MSTPGLKIQGLSRSDEVNLLMTVAPHNGKRQTANGKRKVGSGKWEELSRLLHTNSQDQTGADCPQCLLTEPDFGAPSVNYELKHLLSKAVTEDKLQ